ncbi:MAG TPA: hypothetical protein VD866_06860 [Urbifossiella sp.]|nr:hypothetical protein [Urbifossiella sp.]
MGISLKWQQGEAGGAGRGIRVVCDHCSKEILDPAEGAIIQAVDTCGEGEGPLQAGFYHLAECLTLHLLLVWAEPFSAVITRLPEYTAAMRALGVSRPYEWKDVSSPTTPADPARVEEESDPPPAGQEADFERFRRAMEEAQKKRRKPRGET